MAKPDDITGGRRHHKGIVADRLVNVVRTNAYDRPTGGGRRPPHPFILAIVEFLGDGSHRVHYVLQPFQREPDFGVMSVNYGFGDLQARAEALR